MASSLGRLWRRMVEGSFAHGLANRFGVPSGRREQLRLDMQRAWLAAQLWRISQRNQQPSLKIYQQLLVQSQVVDRHETFPFVANHLRHQILGMAKVLHKALEQAGDAMPAANAFLRAQTALAGHVQPPEAGTTGKVYLSQHQVSQLMHSHWGHALQVKRSTVDHPDAGLGLFVQGSVPVGGVVALLPGIFYTRTQLSRMPNFPKVAQDNPYLSSTIEMSVIDSKPWGLGVRGGEPGCSESASMPASRPHGGAGHAEQHSCSSGSSSSSEAARLHSALDSLHSPALPHVSPPPPPSQINGVPMSEVYPSQSDPLPPLLGYTCAYARQADGSFAQASGCGSWTLAALEERHPLAWAHMANHPGPGMLPNVLEVPFALDLDLGPSHAGLGQAGEHEEGQPVAAAVDPGPPGRTGAHGGHGGNACWLRAYIPCVPFLEPPPHEDLAREGWPQAAAEALLEACGWPRARSRSKTGGKQAGGDGCDGDKEDEEEETVGFHIPGLPASHARKPEDARLHGMALMATQALQDGEEVLLNYRLSPHTVRPPWYHSIDPEAEARRWAQMPLKRLLS